MSESILDLKGRVAMVTGAGQGVGRQTALRLAAHNAGGIVVNDFHAERAQAVADEIAQEGGPPRPRWRRHRLRRGRRGLARAAARFGRIDILVNNAGNAGPTASLGDLVPFWQTDPAEWQRWLGTNLYGVMNCTRHVLPGMIGNRYGRIVTVISDAGRVGEGQLEIYSGAKAGAAGFMRAIAQARAGTASPPTARAGAATRTPGVKPLLRRPGALQEGARATT